MMERFGRDDEAIRYYEAARQIDPNNTIALRRLADLHTWSVALATSVVAWLLPLPPSALYGKGPVAEGRPQK